MSQGLLVGAVARHGSVICRGTRREAGRNSLVFSSTGALYGNASPKPIFEEEAGSTINPYGRSKFMIERIPSDYRASHQFGSVSLRYFNACGADASGSIGELRNPEAHLFPRALMTLQGDVSDFAIYGTDYETPGGTAIRDYILVDDLAAAHIAALELLLRGDLGDVFNVGTGLGYSVRQILDVIRAETGEAVPSTLRERRPGDPPISLSATDAASPLLAEVKSVAVYGQV